MLNTLLHYFIIPFIILVVGLILPYFKTIGPVGYRTYQSMKNQENWNFAQKVSGKAFLLLSGALVLNNLLFYCSILPVANFGLFEGILLGTGLILILGYIEFRLHQLDKKK